MVEVTNISKHGFWLLLPSGELFLSFEAFPWFRNATVGQILNVTLVHDTHLHWPELDVDLAVESIEHPERYPLVSKVESAMPARRQLGAGRIADKTQARKGPKRG